MKKKGFTLAETLMTLGIIGIVAAIAVPAIKNMRPDETKMKYLRTYDSVVEATRKLASDSKVFPPCQEINNGMSFVTRCFEEHPLFNNQTRNGGDNLKYCKELANFFIKASEENICEVGINPSFSAITGEQFQITTTRANTPTWRTQINIDINGNLSPNCNYSANCPKPDRFILWVTADGNVTAGDIVGEYYLINRDNPKNKQIDVSGINLDPAPSGRFAFD